MKELKAPKKKLIKKMYNLILDNHAEDIKLLLFKKGQSIPSLYRNMSSLMEMNKVYISESTFKNLLMDSRCQRYDWETRLKVINLILDYLNPGNVEAAYEMVKQERNRKVRAIMEILKSDYKDKKEYLPLETLMHEYESLPDDMKTYWESRRGI
jgi:hypothetical protein